ncbi:hypothetical protein BH18ACI4_BH18ACI4_28630 [soil metagenome]
MASRSFAFFDIGRSKRDRVRGFALSFAASPFTSAVYLPSAALRSFRTSFAAAIQNGTSRRIRVPSSTHRVCGELSHLELRIPRRGVEPGPTSWFSRGDKFHPVARFISRSLSTFTLGYLKMFAGDSASGTTQPRLFKKLEPIGGNTPSLYMTYVV